MSYFGCSRFRPLIQRFLLNKNGSFEKVAEFFRLSFHMSQIALFSHSISSLGKQAEEEFFLQHVGLEFVINRRKRCVALQC